MKLKKFAPWNWFKKEEDDAGKVAVRRLDEPMVTADGAIHPLVQLHREMDRLFTDIFGDRARSSLFPEVSTPLTSATILRPHVDVAATNDEYTITLEVPGVSENDVKVEVMGDTMVIRGEKKQEKEHRQKNYYRVERAYGSFQRTLSLPEDADVESIKATFQRGVLKIAMDRREVADSEVKQIPVN